MAHWLLAIGGLLALGYFLPTGSPAADAVTSALDALGVMPKTSTRGPKPITTTIGTPRIVTAGQPVSIVSPKASAPVIVGVAAPAPYAPYSASTTPKAGINLPAPPQLATPSYTAPVTTAPAATTPAPVAAPVDSRDRTGRMV